MLERFRFIPISALIVAVMLAALVLGYYSYRFGSQVAQRSEDSVERSNRALGLKLVDRIEKIIIDSDQTLFRLVSLDDPREFRELWRRIVRISPAVESVTVLDEEQRIVHLIAKLPPDSLSSFRETFQRSILPDLELAKLEANHHKHLHKKYDGQYYLISYIRRQSAGHDYSIALSVNVRYLIDEVFRHEFAALEDTNALAVVDADDGTVLYGAPLASESPLVFKERFPTTLYKWRLEVAPRQMAPLSRGIKARRLSNVALVGGAVAVIWAGTILVLIAMRKERRANTLKSEFIANVSHELKTPLSLIRMFGELLSMGRSSDPATTREYAEIIMRESERLTAQIDKVLDFARSERGKVAYDMRPGDVRPVVERVAELCRYRAEQAGVKLALELGNEPLRAVFDDSALTMMLLNLVENALRYAGAPGTTIIVSAALRPSPATAGAQELTLRVLDQGPGIDPEERHKIFERFYRGKAARHSGQRGSGIGLSLVKHVAEAHEGQIVVSAVPGGGACFEVRLPITTDPPLDPSRAPRKEVA